MSIRRFDALIEAIKNDRFHRARRVCGELRGLWEEVRRYNALDPESPLAISLADRIDAATKGLTTFIRVGCRWKIGARREQRIRSQVEGDKRTAKDRVPKAGGRLLRRMAPRRGRCRTEVRPLGMTDSRGARLSGAVRRRIPLRLSPKNGQDYVGSTLGML
jgi:hypothetical protein